MTGDLSKHPVFIHQNALLSANEEVAVLSMRPPSAKATHLIVLTSSQASAGSSGGESGITLTKPLEKKNIVTDHGHGETIHEIFLWTTGARSACISCEF